MKMLIGVLTALSLAAPAFAADASPAYAKCAMCHGKDGTAAGTEGIAKMFKAQLKDLNLTGPSVQSMKDEDIKNAILSGKGKMKPVKVAEADIPGIIAYIRSLAPKPKPKAKS